MTESAQMTDYVVTRWYRAPELIFEQPQYSGAVDVWAVGCILAELITRRPLLPSHSSEDLLRKLIDLVGYPDAQTMQTISEGKNKNFLRKLPKYQG
jgi:mitogen-activated protein kinase 1/3